MEGFEIKVIKKWKAKVENELATLKETIEQKKARREELLIMMQVVSHASETYFIVEEIQNEYWDKYYPSLEQEYSNLYGETTHLDSELNVELKELQCLLNSINQRLIQVVDE